MDEAADWHIEFARGRVADIVCVGCQTVAERAAAAVNDATTAEMRVNQSGHFTARREARR
ncbi:hypothetical protein [[Mycobacterium] zoologicum]|uniref:hypothetical protein n=1 Tax=[Mycobacterium] zoologicum TaxID=2872311 RepID=UPI001CDA7022|nr:hypothetical protein [Mycolicibacter sp. MYC101]MEB3062472.1 hypothetical protein [Mycolicibacter sp. MYC101]